jgi:hypothetical protein
MGVAAVAVAMGDAVDTGGLVVVSFCFPPQAASIGSKTTTARARGKSLCQIASFVIITSPT